MKKDNKQRLFEVMSRLDKTFKAKLNENVSGIDNRENLEYFLSYNNDEIYWKWVNDEIDDYGAIQIINDIDGIEYNPNINYKREYSSMSENIYKDDDPTSRAFRDFVKAVDPEGYKRRWEKERPGEVEPEKEKPKAMNQFKKDLNEKDLNIGRRFKVNPKYTHFAVFKDSNKIATAWEYGHIEPEDLRSDKRAYFYDDLIDWDINPKSVNILSKKYLERKGINPFDWNNWETNEERDVRTGLESA